MTTIYSRITGTGSALPERVLTNADLEKLVERIVVLPTAAEIREAVVAYLDQLGVPYGGSR